MAVFADVLGGESKVHNEAKPCMTRGGRVVISPKG